MKLIFAICAQSSAVDAQTNRLSLFHILEQMQAAALPASLSLVLVGIFAKEAGDPDDHSVWVKAWMGGSVLLESPVAFSFRATTRGRIVAVINGLGIPAHGTLSLGFFSSAGQQLGDLWDVVVEPAAPTMAAPVDYAPEAKKG
jgi:hypothetical protein